LSDKAKLQTLSNMDTHVVRLSDKSCDKEMQAKKLHSELFAVWFLSRRNILPSEATASPVWQSFKWSQGHQYIEKRVVNPGVGKLRLRRRMRLFNCSEVSLSLSLDSTKIGI